MLPYKSWRAKDSLFKSPMTHSIIEPLLKKDVCMVIGVIRGREGWCAHVYMCNILQEMCVGWLMNEKREARVCVSSQCFFLVGYGGEVSKTILAKGTSRYCCYMLVDGQVRCWLYHPPCIFEWLVLVAGITVMSTFVCANFSGIQW